MREEITTLLAFSNRISNLITSETGEDDSFSDLSRFPLIKGKQAVYVMDWSENKITFSRGVEDFLGYASGEFDIESAMDAIHPEDEVIVSRVVKGVVTHCIQANAAGKNEYLNITYRLKRKDGSYVKVLRKSAAYAVNDRGMLVSNWSILTDIDFITNDNQVAWDIHAYGMDVEGFRKNVFKEFEDFFTKAELLVISGIQKGLKSDEIATTLNISKHTVDTHRKNINRKGNCSNAKDLITFCQRNGIL